MSRRLYSIAAPILFRTVAIHALNEKDLSDIDTDSLVAFSSPHVHHIKEVMITAKFHRVLRHRCHDSDFDESDNIDEFEYTESESCFDDEKIASEDGRKSNDGHGSELGGNKGVRWTAHEQFLDALESKLMPFFDLLPDGRLEKFRLLTSYISAILLKLFANGIVQLEYWDLFARSCCRLPLS